MKAELLARIRPICPLAANTFGPIFETFDIYVADLKGNITNSLTNTRATMRKPYSAPKATKFSSPATVPATLNSGQ
jgi:hypothetical protein